MTQLKYDEMLVQYFRAKKKSERGWGGNKQLVYITQKLTGKNVIIPYTAKWIWFMSRCVTKIAERDYLLRHVRPSVRM